MAEPSREHSSSSSSSTHLYHAFGAEEEDYAEWERWLCGVQSGRSPSHTLRSTAWWNLVFALLSGVLVLYTFATTSHVRWGDVDDAAEAALTIPTLLLVLRQPQPPPAGRRQLLRYWLIALTVTYSVGVGIDLATLIAGKWRKAAVRSCTAVLDGSSLYMWANIVFLQRRIIRTGGEKGASIDPSSTS
jgi:hypothetical protein